MKLELFIPDNSEPFEYTSGVFRLRLYKDAPVVVPPTEIIPASRRVDWSLTGIPGGIPSRTTIFRTLPAGATLGEVQSALNACPVNQVVQLSAGNYAFDGNLDFFSVKDGVVLRGDGPDTKLTFSAGSILMRHIFSESALSFDVDLLVGSTKSATTIEIAAVPTWVKAGHVYLIDQLNDAALAKSDGQERALIYRRQLGNGDRGIGQTVKVVSKSATTVTFESPLYLDYPLVNQPQLSKSGYDPVANTPLRGCGIEDLTIDFSYSNGAAHSIKMENCDNCWLKNVTSDNTPGGCHVWTTFCYRCEIFGASFYRSHLYDSGQGYGVALYHASCGWRIQNNTFRDLHVGMQVNYGSSGNVFGYNKVFSGQAVSGQAPGINSHGCHAHMNLFEGNWAENKVLGDFTHGSSSHNTLFRNRIIGHEPGREKDQVCVSLERYNRKWNIVGNVLGEEGWHSVYEAAPWAVPATDLIRAIYKLGYWSNWGGNAKETDSAEVMDLLRYGNYDVVNGIDTYEPTRPLPNSLYLTGKPAWLGEQPWPLFDPLKP